MNRFYEQLPANKKMSLRHSMRILTDDFLDSYQVDKLAHRSQGALVNDLYFYWLRNSAERGYLWCEDLGSEVFSERFTKEMRKAIRKVYQAKS